MRCLSCFRKKQLKIWLSIQTIFFPIDDCNPPPTEAATTSSVTTTINSKTLHWNGEWESKQCDPRKVWNLYIQIFIKKQSMKPQLKSLYQRVDFLMFLLLKVGITNRSPSGVASGWHGWTMSRGPGAKGVPERQREKEEKADKEKKREGRSEWVAWVDNVQGPGAKGAPERKREKGEKEDKEKKREGWGTRKVCCPRVPNVLATPLRSP